MKISNVIDFTVLTSILHTVPDILRCRRQAWRQSEKHVSYMYTKTQHNATQLVEHLTPICKYQTKIVAL